jgi:hypothetical protein
VIRTLILPVLLAVSCLSTFGQDSIPASAVVIKRIAEDSVVVQVHPSYNKHGKFHRWVFGENYRKEWAAPTTLPVIHISEIHGGLIPLQLGGGFQSKSLRLRDPQGKEWIIRSVEKSPDALLPPGFRRTFARDWVDDVTSGQHPFSALVVPPIANAVGVPVATPIIGILSPDRNLGKYSHTFDNLVVLLEAREPLGNTDNTTEMKSELRQDNDNRLEGIIMLNARMLDMLLGDWDRHEDQWRWYDELHGKGKIYVPVPRDRDQVFHLTQGLIPKFASREFILPTLRNFGANLHDPKWIIYKSGFVNAYPHFQFSEEEWMKNAEKFKEKVTDSVLQLALKRLPKSAYDLRHDELLHKLKVRRDILPEAMRKYYRFTQKVIDIQLTDKNEFVEISDAPENGLNIRVRKINRGGKLEDELMNKTYDASLTREVRVYVFDGNDSLIVNNSSSPINIRIIGGKDNKAYHVAQSKAKIRLYDKENGSRFTGDASRFIKHLSNDSVNTSFEPVNLYNIRIPLTRFGLNLDDGFLFGVGFRFIRQGGFRKTPYRSLHEILVSHSFSTEAYSIRYRSEWIHAIKKADIVLQAIANAPNNTLNFFGRGNESIFDKTGDYKTFYRSRFSTYQVNPSLRWRNSSLNNSISIGASFYFYEFDRDDNIGRFINNISLIGSYDSATAEKTKLHVGGVLQLVIDERNNKIFPQKGHYFNLRIVGYKGVTDFAASYAQMTGEFSVYKGFNKKSTIVLAERAGGTVSVGRPAFYQSAFLGGQENLLGYRQYRFAGQHALYNNLELRAKVADIASYIIPGQFGITGFWDIGRVWENHDNSGKWHNGVGGGIYFAPATIVVISFVMGYSSEGWYPYFTMGLRF